MYKRVCIKGKKISIFISNVGEFNQVRTMIIKCTLHLYILLLIATFFLYIHIKLNVFSNGLTIIVYF